MLIPARMMRAARSRGAAVRPPSKLYLSGESAVGRSQTALGRQLKKIPISAHSGGSEHAPAATYEAYEDSLSSGAEYVELDIRKTHDGVLVVYHHKQVPPAGPLVANLAYEELCARLNYTVPKVSDVMQILAGSVIGHLDLKETGFEDEVIELAAKIFGFGNFVATTLEDSSIARIKRSFPQVRTALSLGRDLKETPKEKWAPVRFSELFPLSRIRSCGTDWIAVNYKLARLGVLAQCKRQGIGTMVWTVNSEDLIDRFLADDRVCVLITDRPEYAVKRRAELSASNS
jgi:glycerophosphoryl diester phosphodiesterase